MNIINGAQYLTGFISLFTHKLRHTFEWYGILGWSLFLIQRQDDGDTSASSSGKKHAGFISWLVKQTISTSVFVFLFVSASCMALPFNVIINVTPQWFGELVTPLDRWNENLYEYVGPIAVMIGTHQGVWTLYGGGYDGATSKLSVDAVLRNGTISTWYSPNWQDLGLWEHKRLYNHMAYYKHIPDCYHRDDVICEEQENFLLSFLKDGAFSDDEFKEELETLHLYLELEYPPPPPENLGWWDPLKQPLITERQEMLSWISVGGEEDYMDDNYQDDDEDENWNYRRDGPKENYHWHADENSNYLQDDDEDENWNHHQGDDEDEDEHWNYHQDDDEDENWNYHQDDDEDENYFDNEDNDVQSHAQEIPGQAEL